MSTRAPRGMGFRPHAEHQTPAQQASLNDQLGDAYAQWAEQQTGMSPDEWRAAEDKRRADEEAAEANKPSALESFGRGALQGATLGFSDEIGGALEHAFTSKSYEQARDEIRENDRRAQQAHPLVSGVGGILGGLVPALATGGLGEGAAAASVGRAALTGAGMGALAGAGGSEAKDVGSILRDAAIGGALGAGTGALAQKGANALLARAPEAADEDLIAQITGGRATKAGKAVWKDSGIKAETARKFGLDKVAGAEPAELAAAAEAPKAQVGQAIGDVFRSADAQSPGLPLPKLKSALTALEQDYRANPATRPVADAVKGQIEDMEAAWGSLPQVNGVPHVPAEKVWQYASELGDIGFRNAGLDPKTAVRAQQQAWGAVKDLLTDHVESVTPGAKETLAGLNQDYQGLKAISNIARERAQLPPPSRAAGGLRNAVEGATRTAGVLHSLGTGNPLPALAAVAGVPAMRASSRAATAALADVVRSARAGSVSARQIQRALQIGVPRSAIDGVLGLYRAARPAAEPEDEPGAAPGPAEPPGLLAGAP